MDKSATHYRIVKNGVSGWLNKLTVDAIGKENLEKNEGYIFLSETPPEVTVMRQKISAITQDQKINSGDVLKVKNTEEDIEDLSAASTEVKKRGRPKTT